LHGGKQEGSTLITIESKDLQVSLIPTRGMNIYEIKSGDVRYGWKSPVDEIVNPAFMNLEMRKGLGWLDGFNEMMVRCGYEWTGHPGEVDGKLLSLHGRAGNTPASKVVVSINFGSPILEEGAKFVAPVKEISPFNNYAKKGLKDWQTYLAPTRNFDEMVFNLVPYADKDGKTTTMLHNKAANKGIAVSYDTKQLPVLTLWKNTDTLKQGYVTGIEPGTSYAYPRQFEKEQGRVKTLSPSARQAFDLEYRVMTTADEVTTVQKEIDTIAAGQTTKLINKPMRKE
jgi:hypothetical protein